MYQFVPSDATVMDSPGRRRMETAETVTSPPDEPDVPLTISNTTLVLPDAEGSVTASVAVQRNVVPLWPVVAVKSDDWALSVMGVPVPPGAVMPAMAVCTN